MERLQDSFNIHGSILEYSDGIVMYVIKGM
jgi:hypothetical protein